MGLNHVVTVNRMLIKIHNLFYFSFIHLFLVELSEIPLVSIQNLKDILTYTVFSGITCRPLHQYYIDVNPLTQWNFQIH